MDTYLQKKSPYSILDLLPYTEQTQLVSKHQKLDDLYFIKSVVDFSIIALQSFLSGSLHEFDAQAGENLCQIRAYKILRLAHKLLKNPKAKAEFSKSIDVLSTYKYRIEDVINGWETQMQTSNHYNKELDRAELIHSFLEKHDLFQLLEEDWVFIIACYFLTHFNIRNNGIPVAINLDYISQELHISKYRAKKLSHNHQKLICKLGCDFIMDISKDLPKSYGYATLLPLLYRISDESRAVLPCFIVTEIIIRHCLMVNTPILMLVHKKFTDNSERQDIISLLIKGDRDHPSFELIRIKDNLSTFCFVVSGSALFDSSGTIENPSSFIGRLLNENPLKLILANTASHPQYSGKKLALFRQNPFLDISTCSQGKVIQKHTDNLVNYQRFAMIKGCAKENQTTFFLKHIYASTVSNAINGIKQSGQLKIYDSYELCEKDTQ